MLDHLRYFCMMHDYVAGFQAVTPSRDVRAQFYSRMGLMAATAAQPPQSATENQVVIPSCSSSAEDDGGSKGRATLTKGKDSENVDKPVIGYEGRFRFLSI